MKILKRIPNLRCVGIALITLSFPGLAAAHGFSFEGGESSTAALVASALLQTATNDPTIKIEGSPDSGNVFREDKTGAIKCSAGQTYKCLIVEKHKRPLEPLENYGLGDYVDLEAGDGSSNAALVYALMQSQVSQGLVQSKAVSATRTEASFADAAVKIVCAQITDSKNAEIVLSTECELNALTK